MHAAIAFGSRWGLTGPGQRLVSISYLSLR